MEALQNTTLWLVLLSSVCLVAMGHKWRKAHPRCECCCKHIRRVFMYCPWCGLLRAHASHVPVRHRRASRRQQDALVAQEAAMPPHKRRRTVILPTSSRQRIQRRYHQGTVLVPDPYVASHVKTCADCETVLHEDDVRCWWCDSTTLTWKEKRR
jgi:hypothetical protein